MGRLAGFRYRDIVRKLKALGLVERQRSASDDRSVLISLTPAGAQLRERAHAVNEQIGCATQHTGEQRQALAHSLQNLRVALLGSAQALLPSAGEARR